MKMRLNEWKLKWRVLVSTTIQSKTKRVIIKKKRVGSVQCRLWVIYVSWQQRSMVWVLL